MVYSHQGHPSRQDLAAGGRHPVMHFCRKWLYKRECFQIPKWNYRRGIYFGSVRNKVC